MDKKNTIKVYTSSSGAELNISAPSVKQLISATNNRAQYFAEQAQKYRDEAKIHRDSAKYYAEQNSNVTFEYVENIRDALESKILEKQPIGNYALKEELPQNVSELVNDSKYVNEQQLANSIDEVRLPSQEGVESGYLYTDGQNLTWIKQPSAEIFEQINNSLAAKADKSDLDDLKKSYLVQSYVNGASGYRIWSDGFCEQWGDFTGVKKVYDLTIHYLKPFASTAYNLVITKNSGTNGSMGVEWIKGYKSKSVQSFVTASDNPPHCISISWRACGYVVL